MTTVIPDSDLAKRKAPAGRTALRWVIAAVVLVLAVAVAAWPALWPSTWPSAWSRDAGRGGAASQPTPDLDTWRQRAALADCPTGSAEQPRGVLAGITVPCLGDGGSVDLGTALAGRDTLLSVWSHSCAPCREELPALQEYAARPGAVPVLGVQVDGTPQAGLALLTALGVHLPSVTDADGTVRAALSAPAVLPLTYVVAADGSVRMVNPPVVFRSPEEVDAVVRRYLAGS